MLSGNGGVQGEREGEGAVHMATNSYSRSEQLYLDWPHTLTHCLARFKSALVCMHLTKIALSRLLSLSLSSILLPSSMHTAAAITASSLFQQWKSFQYPLLPFSSLPPKVIHLLLLFLQQRRSSKSPSGKREPFNLLMPLLLLTKRKR